MDWKVFQTDVLDALNQYKEFFDFFERTGTLSDNSRPDCIARVTRERKKIWVFDAKNKDEVDAEDEERMEKYIQQLKINPLDIGLDHSELGDHEVEGVFITRGECSSDFDVIDSKKLHQYLRKELIYTETDRVIRDVTQMTEKKVLTHSQARMLYRSLKDFKDQMDRARKLLQEIEDRFTGLKLKEHPLKGWESLPVDFILEHETRPNVFIDVPYKDEDEREISEFLEDDSIYVSLGGEGKYGCPFDEFEDQLMRKLGILSWEKVAELYTPKVPTEKSYGSNTVVIEDSQGLGFRAEIKSVNDTEFRIETKMPEKAFQRLKDQSLNSRKKYGDTESGYFRHSFKVRKGLEIDYGVEESFKAYLDTVNSVFQSSVNPVLSKKVTHRK